VKVEIVRGLTKGLKKLCTHVLTLYVSLLVHYAMLFGNKRRKIGGIRPTCRWYFEIYHTLGKTSMLQLKVTMGH